MCQAYEAEANFLRWMERRDRIRQARIQGAEDQRRGVPKDANPNKPSWLTWEAARAHHFDGPLLAAWEEGWEEAAGYKRS